tara:strand:+ start:143 stop:427 length:285 start_codon:yes stop_codon:yes gene_type:complete
MTLYQVYRWDNDNGPTVSFHGTKKEALAKAKELRETTTIDGDLEVSRVKFPSKKADLLRYLNEVGAAACMPIDKDIASFEGRNPSEDEDEWSWQ